MALNKHMLAYLKLYRKSKCERLADLSVLQGEEKIVIAGAMAATSVYRDVSRYQQPAGTLKCNNLFITFGIQTLKSFPIWISFHKHAYEQIWSNIRKKDTAQNK